MPSSEHSVIKEKKSISNRENQKGLLKVNLGNELHFLIFAKIGLGANGTQSGERPVLRAFIFRHEDWS